MSEKFSYNKKDYSSLSKTKIGKVIRLLIDPEYRFNAKVRFGLTDSMSDEEFIKRKFKLAFGYDLNLEIKLAEASRQKSRIYAYG